MSLMRVHALGHTSHRTPEFLGVPRMKQRLMNVHSRTVLDCVDDTTELRFPYSSTKMAEGNRNGGRECNSRTVASCATIRWSFEGKDTQIGMLAHRLQRVADEQKFIGSNAALAPVCDCRRADAGQGGYRDIATQGFNDFVDCGQHDVA